MSLSKLSYSISPESLLNSYDISTHTTTMGPMRQKRSLLFPMMHIPSVQMMDGSIFTKVCNLILKSKST